MVVNWLVDSCRHFFWASVGESAWHIWYLNLVTVTSVCGLTRLHAKGVLRPEQTKTAERDLVASIEYQVNRIQERSFNKIMKLLEE